uniref:Uncharacterized protein n=1 Tax=Cucumis melo TaxID=3656 RepID=A0A9I9CFV9_CUCME
MDRLRRKASAISRLVKSNPVSQRAERLSQGKEALNAVARLMVDEHARQRTKCAFTPLRTISRSNV